MAAFQNPTLRDSPAAALSREQLLDMICRKDQLTDRAALDLRRAWALLWLSFHASETGKEEDYNEAAFIVLGEALELATAARAALERHTGVYYRVANGLAEDEEPVS